MKKLFLTSGLVLCMACPAMADPITGAANNRECVYDVLGSYTGPVDIEAQWTKNKYNVTYVACANATLTGTGIYENDAEYDTDYRIRGLGTGSDDSGITMNTGYHLTGWLGSSTARDYTPATYQPDHVFNPYEIAGALTLTAQCTHNISGRISLDSTIYPNNNSGAIATYTTSTGVQGSSPDALWAAYNIGLFTSDTAATAGGTPTSSITIPEKAGYVFDGFYDGNTRWINGEGTIDTDTVKTLIATQNNAETKTLYAHWHADSYTITYAPGQAGNRPTDPNYVTGSTSSTSVTYDDTNVALAQNGFSATGYHFVGWKSDYKLDDNTQPSGGQIYGTTGTGNTDWTVPTVSRYAHPDDITLTAQWAPNHYTVTFNSGAHSSTATNTTVHTDTNGAEFDAAYTIPAGAAVTAATGYTFAGWNTAENQTVGNFESGNTWTFAANTTLYAAYSANPTKLVYNCWQSNSNPPVAGNWTGESQYNVNYDDTYSHPSGTTYCANLATHGYTFRGWNCVGDDSSQPAATVVTTNAIANEGIANGKWAADYRHVTCTALWEANTINLTWYNDTVANNGTVMDLESTDPAKKCSYDSTLTLPSQPSKTGYTFNGWHVRPAAQSGQ